MYLLSKKFLMMTKIFYLHDRFFVALEYLFNVFILFKTVSYLKFNFKLKIGPKMCTLKNLEEFWKSEKNLPKKFSNPAYNKKEKIKKTNKNFWQPCKYENS